MKEGDAEDRQGNRQHGRKRHQRLASGRDRRRRPRVLPRRLADRAAVAKAGIYGNDPVEAMYSDDPFD